MKIPAFNSGNCPTTPEPFTSSTISFSMSLIIQCLPTNCTCDLSVLFPVLSPLCSSRLKSWYPTLHRRHTDLANRSQTAVQCRIVIWTWWITIASVAILVSVLSQCVSVLGLEVTSQPFLAGKLSSRWSELFYVTISKNYTEDHVHFRQLTEFSNSLV